MVNRLKRFIGILLVAASVSMTATNSGLKLSVMSMVTSTARYTAIVSGLVHLCISKK